MYSARPERQVSDPSTPFARAAIRGRGLAGGPGSDLVGGRIGGARMPALDGGLRAGELRSREACGDLVAPLRRLRVALGGGEGEPLIGSGEILSGARAAQQENARIELAVPGAVFRRLRIP